MFLHVCESLHWGVSVTETPTPGAVEERRHAWRGGGVCVAGETATAAGGTHPTGMYSCFNSVHGAFT